MKKFYLTLGFSAILLFFFILLYFVNIPAPVKTVVETYNLEIK